MAYVETRTNSAGKNRYIGRYRVDGKLCATRSFTRKREAEAEAARLEDAAKRSDYVDPRAAEVTLDEWFEARQAARRDRAPRTLESERERYSSLIQPTFGSRPLKRITPEDVATWGAQMQSARSGVTASAQRRKDAFRLLSAVLKDAVNARRLSVNPCVDRSGSPLVSVKVVKTKPHRYLSPEELQRLAACASTPQGTLMIMFAGLTAVRWGELSALRVSDVDFKSKRISVTRAYTRLDSGELLLGPTKTNEPRKVPLPKLIEQALREHVGSIPIGGLLFPNSNGDPLRSESFSRNTLAPAVALAGGAVSALQELVGVFPTGHYDDATEQAVRAFQARVGIAVDGVCGTETWQALAREKSEAVSALTQGQKVKRTNKLKRLSATRLFLGCADFEPLTTHDLRHTGASLAISSGANVKTVQALLGHKSARLTLDTYAGLFPDDFDALTDGMSDMFENLQPASSTSPTVVAFPATAAGR